MGGQACVLYGAAEFSRDTDLAILCTTENLARLQEALSELQAKVIAVPPFNIDYLERGHSIHFRCEHPDAANLRVDIMSRMRGVAPFKTLLANQHPEEITSAAITQRPLLQLLSGNNSDLETALRDEEEKERQRDKKYWQPLKQELEQLRRQRLTK